MSETRQSGDPQGTRSSVALTRDFARAYVKRWTETGRLLEEVRWCELAALDEDSALRASDALLEYGASLPLAPRRREWSGLVEQQRLFWRHLRR